MAIIIVMHKCHIINNHSISEKKKLKQHIFIFFNNFNHFYSFSLKRMSADQILFFTESMFCDLVIGFGIITLMNPSVYLRTGDLITISYESLFLAIDSLTQSVPTMRESVLNSLNAVFVLTTQKCLEKSLDEQKPLQSYKEDDIYYSEPIVLYHLLSGKFLSYSRDIENKATVELISTFKENCKFSIKPIFKCQTVITRKIRNQESVVISPAEAFNHEGNIALVILRNDSRKGEESYILMKKNENSKFQLARKNQHSIHPSSLSNVWVYQLLNIETRKNLYMIMSKNKDLITFEKIINEFGSYFDIRLKESEFESIGVHEKQIQYGMVFYIHSWKQNKYLSINVIGDACLTEVPNQEAEFVIESYSDLELRTESVVRIKHVATQKYLSLNTQAAEVQMTHELKLIDTFMIMKMPIEELRLNVFINDAHEIIQKEMSGKKISYNNRESIFKVLKELINFIYGDQITIADFLSMKIKISCRLSSDDQKLLANIGIINTLVRMCRIFIEEITSEKEKKEFEQRDNTDEQIIIIYTMMSIVGICMRNAPNTRILVQEMPVLYESLATIGGIIESFYNLFKDSKELLLILENTSHKIGRKDVPSMEVLINLLQGVELDIPIKIKLLKLLEIFIIVNHREKILGHQAILLKSLIEKKLQNVMLPLKSNDHEDLFIFIPQKKSYEELEEVLNTRRSYEKELELVKTQLQLICSLCLNSNSSSFAYANKIISEEMLYRYLRGNLQPDFKEIFMRYLIDVYLSNLASRNNSASKSFIICNSGTGRRVNRQFSHIEASTMRQNLLSEEGEELSDISKASPSHSKIIENIQNYILEMTKKSIINQIIDSSFYMNLKSLRKFLDLRILDKDEVIQFRQLLIQYVTKFSKVSFKEEEKKKIVLEVIKIMTDYLNQHIEAISEDFIVMLKQERVPQEKVFSRFLQFIKGNPFFDSKLQQEQLKFLPKLIKESIEFNSVEIFMAASNLFKLINERTTVLFSRLRNKIIIDSDWSLKFYNKIDKLKRGLISQIQLYMSSKSDQKKASYIEEQLNQIIKQLNFCYFDNERAQNHAFSELTQNMYREMGLLEIIVSFLNESQDKFKEGIKGSIDIFSTCFEFIGLYLQDNRENFYRFQNKYLDIKFVFEHGDRGQIKFLNYLIKMPNARDLMMDEIIDCIILSFEHNPEPNPYTLLTLLNAISNPHIDKDRIEMLVERILKSPAIFESIIKVAPLKNSSAFVWSSDPKAKNYHKDWLLYAFLMIKFLLILLEQSAERTTLALEIQKYIKIHNLIDLLKSEDLLVNTSQASLQGSLLKNQVMKLFVKIYLPLLEKQLQEIENISSFVHSVLRGLGMVKEGHEGANSELLDEVMMRSTEHGSIIFESEIRSKNILTVKEFEKYFNPIYASVVQYMPFVIRLLDKLANANAYIESNPAKRGEIGIYIEDTYRKLRDFIQYKLTYKQFNAYHKEYQSAISNCEDLLKRKLGFNLSIEDDDEEEDVGEVEVAGCFINIKIENTAKCYRAASNDVEKHIYQTFIYIFHSEQFRSFLRAQEESFPIHFSLEELEKIFEMMIRFIKQDHEKLADSIRLFYFFSQFNRKNSLELALAGGREQIMCYLTNEKEDAGNQKLCSYLAVTKSLFLSEIECDHHIERKMDGYTPFKEDFINRICRRLEVDKLLYGVSKINQQAVIYSQNGLLSFENIESLYSIELCLEWVRNMVIITPDDLKEKLYSRLFMEIVDLLKVYTMFIKQFNSKYITLETYRKVNLCLQIIFHFVSGVTSKSILINYLIERQIWNDFNLALGLDDGWVRNLEELEDTQKQTFTKVIKQQLRTMNRIFLKQAQKYYLNTKKCYKDLIPECYFPLLPMKSLFGQLKSNVVSILKEIKNFPFEIQKQLFSRMDMTIVNKNIFEVYQKHHRLFNGYGIPSVEIDIDYSDRNEWRNVADNIVFENGADLTSIKMHISTISGNYEIKTEYNNLRLEALTTKKIQSAFSSLVAFVKDFFLLFISCFISLCRKKKKTYRKDEQEVDEQRMVAIYTYFLTKIGRVEVIAHGKELLSSDFLIRPECTLNKDTKDKFIEKINFISMQLKMESIYSQAGKLLLQFQNQIDFYRVFNKFSYLTFLTKNVEMLTYLNYAVIVAQNMILIVNSNSRDEYFTTNSLDQPFVWLQIADIVIAGSIMLAYCVKDLHLLIKQINRTLKIRGESYGSNYNNYNAITKFGIKASKVVSDPTFAYHLIYTLIVCLVFYNKLFAAVLMLDIFFQIPTLKNLMMSVWRPKIELVLALFSFVLLQYFFSIFMFFNFKKQTLGYCNTLGACFGFVFVTTYKAVGGFVGYLFVKNNSQIDPVNFFQIFQDMYVVLIYQIFFGLILAIIIDTFSLIRSEQSIRKDYLNGCCIVCNLDKTRFNSSTMSFKAHIAITHNIWNYFYYYQYVFHKPALKRTSYEREIFLTKSAAWLPIEASFDIADEKLQPEQRAKMIKD